MSQEIIEFLKEEIIREINTCTVTLLTTYKDDKLVSTHIMRRKNKLEQALKYLSGINSEVKSEA